MGISLEPELEEIINQKVASGLYASAEEVVQQALKLLQERDDDRNQPLEDLRGKIQLGLDSLKRGERDLWEIDSIKTEGRKLLAAEQDNS